MSVWREVQEALYQRWVDGWVADSPATGPRTPFVFANEGFDPPEAAWARFTVQRLTGGPATIGGPGNRRMDRVGLVMISIFEPPGNGSGNLADLAEYAANLFENCRLPVHGIHFGDVDPGQAGDASSDGSGRWWGVVIEARFEYEEIK